MIETPVIWARKYAATIDDAPSLRTMYRLAKGDIERNERIRKECRAINRASLIEWNRVTKPEDTDSREAMRLCRAGLKRLGMPL